MLPDKYFCEEHTQIQVFDMDSIHDSLEQQVKRAQYPEQKCLKEWASTHNLSTEDGTHWFKGTAMVVVENNNLRRGVMLKTRAEKGP